ncbi:proton-conducting transporter transmembrane domain-containing protein [Melioribacter sp. OK-6-Me]|uniref:proton-conducting transporter transmembrane domain-containing protein n=1 Tax=unclassified Melioribacter TaxID=2627329 RepID=UPI003EDB5B6F
MIGLVLVFPVLLAIIGLIVKNKLVNRINLGLTSAAYLFVSIQKIINNEFYFLPDWLLQYFAFDEIGLFFLFVMTIVFGGVSIYLTFYFKEHNLSAAKESVFVAELLLFLAAMSGVILSTHLALLWVFIEATTLTSALLIYFEKKKSSLEATWKYIYICSIGIALAFVGIILLSIGTRQINSLYFDDLYNNANLINIFWLKIAFAFLFVGLGTKIGIAPIHAWLPDAHSEAPSPVSAMLSGTLLNSAFLGLIRVHQIFIKTNLEDFSNFFFMLTGFLSLFVSSVFMLRTKNYKRMLAYSSIENMGILFIGISAGKYGIYAAMLHTLSHSFAKASLFLTSGNILYLFKSKKIDDIKDLIKLDPKTAWLWIISALAIIGLPPFPIFISKFFIIKALWVQGVSWLAILFFLFIVIIGFGIFSSIFNMAFRNDDSASSYKNYNLGWQAYTPQVVLLIILFFIGINTPAFINELINNAANFLR